MSPLPPVYPRLYILAPAVGAEQHQSRGLEHWQTLAAPQVPRAALARQAEEHHRVEEDKEHKSRKLPSQARKHCASRQKQHLDTPSVGRQALSCDHMLHDQCVTEMRRRGVSPETFALLAKPPFVFPVEVDLLTAG